MKRHDRIRKLHLAAALLVAGRAVAAAQDPVSPHESIFLEDLPIVLSASRLLQPLADAPGAVSLIDRDLIRASGAREVVDLLRLVPGFQVGMSYFSRPAAAYHGLADEFSRRMQVLIDGRAIYSPYFLGSIDWNNLRLCLDDIERIEVLRGSNSAAYGANAFMGVVNIVTRHPGQSQGTRLDLARGAQGIEDHALRHGGSVGDLDYRIRIGRRSDNGFAGFHDSRQTEYAAFRGDARLGPRDDLQVQAGFNRSAYGTGFAGSLGDPLRTPHERGFHLQTVWKRSLGADEDLTVNLYHLRDSGTEKYTARALIPNPAPFPPTQLSAFVDADRRSERSHLEIQHVLRIAPAARVVWGLEQRHESVTSRLMFGSDEAQHTRLTRLFGNLEWRLAPMWLVNAGAMLERHSLSGTDLSPRLMLNFQPAPDQTLRLGTTTAYRTPSLAEERALVRYDVTVTPPPPFPPTRMLLTTHDASGGLRAEKVRTSELSYLGEFRRIGLSVDARAFHENVGRIIDKRGDPADFLNRWGALVRGLEYQLRWTPAEGTLILFNQARLRIDSEDGRLGSSAPRRSTTLLLSHKLPWGLEASLVHHWIGGFRWLGWSNALPMQRRLDLRLAYPFRSGPLKGEFALVVQNVKGPHSEFRTDYVFERRSFATLSLEY